MTDLYVRYVVQTSRNSCRDLYNRSLRAHSSGLALVRPPVVRLQSVVCWATCAQTHRGKRQNPFRGMNNYKTSAYFGFYEAKQTSRHSCPPCRFYIVQMFVETICKHNRTLPFLNLCAENVSCQKNQGTTGNRVIFLV